MGEQGIPSIAKYPLTPCSIGVTPIAIDDTIGSNKTTRQQSYYPLDMVTRQDNNRNEKAASELDENEAVVHTDTTATAK